LSGPGRGYHLPKRPLLTAEEEGTLSAQIQGHIDELADQFEPGLWRLVDGLDPGPYTPAELFAAARLGLRSAIVAHLGQPAGGSEAFRVAVIDNIQESVTAFVDSQHWDAGATQDTAQ